MKKCAIVVPTIRQESIMRFIKEWNIEDNEDYTLFVIEDHKTKEFTLPKYIRHYSHEEIMNELFPYELMCLGSASNRIFGFWRAWKEGYSNTLTLDDDCYPEPGDNIFSLIKKHEEVLRPTRNNHFHHTMEEDYARGVPYVYRTPTKVAVSIGGWSNVPDVDGITQLDYETIPTARLPHGNRTIEIVPYGVPITLCGMNVFFPTEMTPYMFFWPHLGLYKRYDDIWLGYVLKLHCDKHNLAICINGNASIRHDRASNAMSNLKKESDNGGYELNAILADNFYKAKDNFFHSNIKEFDNYLHKIKNLYIVWLTLFGVQYES